VSTVGSAHRREFMSTKGLGEQAADERAADEWAAAQAEQVADERAATEPERAA